MTIGLNSSADNDASSVDRLLADYLRRVDRGAAPDLDAFLAEHSQQAAELRAYLERASAIGKLVQVAADMPQGFAAEGSLTGAILGDYELQEELGRGGMGVVYRAKQRSLDRVVAVKLMSSGRWTSPTDAQRFHNEAQIAASLQHPQIAKIHEVGQWEGVPYFSMDLIAGRSLRDAIAERALTPREGADLVEKVARAVHFAHVRSVLHRDLKPSNILLDTAGEPHVVDFGLARKIDSDSDLTRSQQVLGTPSYMSPEQARGDHARVGPQADVYGLGAVLYELLTAQPPFRRATHRETIDQVLSSDPAPPRSLNGNVPRDLETICLKCLEKDPDRRYATAEQLADDLRRFARGEPVQARPASVAYRAMKFARRNKVLVGGVVSTIAVLVVGLVGVGIALARAVAAEGEARHLLLDSYVRQAERSVGEEGLTFALENLDRAIAAGHEDADLLRVHRAELLLALNRTDAAAEEVDALLDTGELSTSVRAAGLLLKADILLGGDNDQALLLARQAEALGLDHAADRAYAESLLAESADDSLRCLRAALEARPRPFRRLRSYHVLCTTLFLLGERQTLREYLKEARAFFPQDGGLELVRALLLASEGRQTEARQVWTENRQKLSDRDALAGALFVELIAEYRDPTPLLLSNDATTAILKKELARLGQWSATLTVGPAQKSEAMRFSLPPILERSWGRLSQFVVPFGLWDPPSDRVAEELRLACQVLPEGTLHYLYGQALWNCGRRRDAEAVLRESLELPAMVNVRPLALYFLARMAGQFSIECQGEEAAHWRRQSRQHLSQFLREGGLQAGCAELLAELAIRMGDLELARSIALEWRKLDPLGPRPRRRFAQDGLLRCGTDAF